LQSYDIYSKGILSNMWSVWMVTKYYDNVF